MAIAIVEELWTRIRAAIDDKIVAAEAAASSAEAAAGVAEAAAQSAVTGVQADTVGRAHLTSELRGEIDGKADVGHTHTPASIGAAAANHIHTPEDITRTGVSLVAGYLVQREADSPNIRVSEVPLETYHAASKHYVDGQVAANKGYVDARTPEIRVVSTIPASPTPGVVYLRFG